MIEPLFSFAQSIREYEQILHEIMPGLNYLFIFFNITLICYLLINHPVKVFPNWKLSLDSLPRPPIPRYLNGMGIAFVPVMYIAIVMAIDIRGIRKGKTRNLSGWNTDEIWQINNAYLPRPHERDGKFYNIENEIFVRRRLFSYTIDRLTDFNFTIIDWATIKSNGRECLSIFAEHKTKTGRQFNFNILSDDFSEFCANTDVVMQLGQSVHDDFYENFTGKINEKPKFDARHIEYLEDCFACYSKQPDVIIRRNCDGDSCSSCSCRPTWCAACFARIFAAAQTAHRPSQWTEGTASCPTCRATFCLDDVRRIIVVEKEWRPVVRMTYLWERN